MPTSTITSKGQTTVPKEVRDALEVGPGDRLTWEVRGGEGLNDAPGSVLEPPGAVFEAGAADSAARSLFSDVGVMLLVPDCRDCEEGSTYPDRGRAIECEPMAVESADNRCSGAANDSC